jgi:hypothetical protein
LGEIQKGGIEARGARRKIRRAKSKPAPFAEKKNAKSAAPSNFHPRPELTPVFG